MQSIYAAPSSFALQSLLSPELQISEPFDGNAQGHPKKVNVTHYFCRKDNFPNLFSAVRARPMHWPRCRISHCAVLAAAGFVSFGCGSSTSPEETNNSLTVQPPMSEPAPASVVVTSSPSSSECTEAECVAQGLHCSPGIGCVDCSLDSHCAAGMTCSAATCQAGTASADCRAVTCPTGSTCAVTGGSPQCLSHVCVPDGVTCDPENKLALTCAADGLTFASAVDCGAAGLVCVNGECETFQCVVGEQLCVNNQIHNCSEDGQSTVLVSTCPAEQNCVPNTVRCEATLCVPDATYCEGNLVQTCNAEGSGPAAGAGVDCGINSCIAGACQARSCIPNTGSCEGDQLTLCDAFGAATEVTDCGADRFCDDRRQPATCTDNVCQPGQQQCDGGGVATCKADGAGFETQSCADGTSCQDGMCQPVLCEVPPAGANGSGDVTVYWFRQGTDKFGDIACGYGINVGDNQGNGDTVSNITTGDGALFGAMNTAEFGNSAVCGSCVELQHQGRSVTITIADHCPIDSNPTCTKGHIDLSRAAFQQLTGQNTGEIRGVTWRFVTCPTEGNVQFRLAKPNDQFWNEFVVLNHKHPITKAEVLVGGEWLVAERQDYNFWRPPLGNMGSYRVRITDTNGGIIEEQLELSGGVQGGSHQFQCQ